MKRCLALVAIATLGVFTIGCDRMTGTAQNKTKTRITQTKDGKTTGASPNILSIETYWCWFWD